MTVTTSTTQNEVRIPAWGTATVPFSPPLSLASGGVVTVSGNFQKNDLATVPVRLKVTVGSTVHRAPVDMHSFDEAAPFSQSFSGKGSPVQVAVENTSAQEIVLKPGALAVVAQ